MSYSYTTQADTIDEFKQALIIEIARRISNLLNQARTAHKLRDSARLAARVSELQDFQHFLKNLGVLPNEKEEV